MSHCPPNPTSLDQHRTSPLMHSCNNVLRALNLHLCGSYLSLPQKPRTEHEDVQFGDALGCMGGLYASALATTVMRHQKIPARPANLDGVVAFCTQLPPTCDHPAHAAEHTLADGDEESVPPLHRATDEEDVVCSLCDSVFGPFYGCEECEFDVCFRCCQEDGCSLQASIKADEPAVRNALSAHGELLEFTEQTSSSGGCWHAKFDSHERAQNAVSALSSGRAMVDAGLDGAFCFILFNSRPYFTNEDTGEAGRGWTTFESGVSVEVLSRTQYAHGGLRKMLDKLPPKLVDIDVHPARSAVVDFNEKLAAIKRSTAVRAAIAVAEFTGKGDKKKVATLYQDYASGLVDAIDDLHKSIKYVDDDNIEYSGNDNIINKIVPDHEFAIETTTDEIYKGTFVDMQYHGWGEKTYSTGDVYTGWWEAGESHGEGVYTTPGKQPSLIYLYLYDPWCLLSSVCTICFSAQMGIYP